MTQSSMLQIILFSKTILQKKRFQVSVYLNLDYFAIEFFFPNHSHIIIQSPKTGSTVPYFILPFF